MVICPLSSLDLHPLNIQTRLNFLRSERGYGSQESNHPNGLVAGKARGGKGFLALLSPSQLMSAHVSSSQLFSAPYLGVHRGLQSFDMFSNWFSKTEPLFSKSFRSILGWWSKKDHPTPTCQLVRRIKKKGTQADMRSLGPGIPPTLATTKSMWRCRGEVFSMFSLRLAWIYMYIIIYTCTQHYIPYTVYPLNPT